MPRTKKAAKIRHAVRSYARANQARPMSLQELIDNTSYTRPEVVNAVNELVEQKSLIATAPNTYQYQPVMLPIADTDGITHPPENDFLQ